MNGETCDRSRASRSPHRIPRPAQHAEWQTRADDAAARLRSQDHAGSAAPEIPTARPTPSRSPPPCARTPRARPPGHPHAPRRARDGPASARDDPPAVPAPAPVTARPGPLPPSHPAPGSPHGESPRPSPASSNTRAAGAPSRTTATPPSAPPPAAAPARRALPPGSTPPATAVAPSHAQFPAARPPAAGPTRLRTRTTTPPPPDSASMHSPEPARRDARETPAPRPRPTDRDAGGRETRRTALPTRRTTPRCAGCNAAPAPPPVTGRAGSSALPPRHDRWATSCHPTGYTGVHKGQTLRTHGSSSPSRHYGNRRRSVLLTNASRRLSGDHDGTLIVPCPPYTYATTRALPPPARVDITRRYTCL